MTPKEKARELVDKFYYFTASFGDEQARECAIIAVEEVLLWRDLMGKEMIQYFEEVLTEIKNL
jgi:hypothetical protein